jgi:hypothetical protein
MRDLTDSFCERCGTRYVFTPSQPKGSLASARVLAQGLKHFVMSDGTSMEDAMTAARTDAEREDSVRIAEQFHQTFNFCMTCRQYTCSSCWNEKQGACLTCAPDLDYEPIAPQDRLIVRTPVTRGDRTSLGLPESRVYGRRPTDLAPVSQAWSPDEPLFSDAGPTGTPFEQQPATPGWAEEPDRSADWTLWPDGNERPAVDLEAVFEERRRREMGSEEAPYVDPNPRAVVRQRYPGAEEESPAPSEPQQADEPAEPGRPTLVTRLLGHHPQEDGAPPPKPAPRSRKRRGEQAADPWPHPTRWSERVIVHHDWWGDEAVGADVAEPTPAPVEPAPPLEAYHRYSPARRAAHRPPAYEPAAEPARAAPEPLFAEPEDLSQPAAAQFETPAAPQYEAPAAPQYEAPAAQFETPAAPQYEAPAAPQVEAPAAQFEPEPEPAGSSQQPLFDLPPASHDRWAPRPEVPSRPRRDRDESPEQAWGVPASSADANATAQAPGEASSWPPVGASLPAQSSPDIPWPAVDLPQVPAGIVAAQRAQQAPAPSVWTESAREVLNRGTVRVCHRCALPVSTHARFCRRCGTEQV